MEATALPDSAVAAPERGKAGPHPALVLVLAIFIALSLTVVGTIAWNVVVHGAKWTGAIGYVFDSMQYLAWVREGADHFLSGNLFTLDAPVRNYINPGLIISSGLHVLGLSVPLAYAFWIPVGIVLVIWAALRFTSWLLPDAKLAGVAVIALALLYKIPIANIAKGHVPELNVNALTYGSTDAWPVYWSWGFSLTAVSVALLAFGLMQYDRVRDSGKAFSAPLMALALLCSWLQPWQGAILLGLIAGGELIAGLAKVAGAGLRGRVTLIGSAVLAGALPLAYYAILGKVDESWRINGIQANYYVAGASWWVPLAILFPMLAMAALAYRVKPESFKDVAVRLWPIVAIAELYAIQWTGAGNTSTHALKGITFPLAVLVAIGIGPWIKRLHAKSAGAAVALVTVGIGLLFIPGAWKQIDYQQEDMKLHGRGGYYYISTHDKEALAWISQQHGGGGVYSSSLYGSMVPWWSDRSVWVGHETWTPRFQGRSYFNENALNGNLPRITDGLKLAEVVKWTGARWVFQDCYHKWVQRTRKFPSLDAQLAPVTKSLKRFGCATVYEITPGRGPAPPGIERYHLDWTKADDR